jgi:allantoicase
MTGTFEFTDLPDLAAERIGGRVVAVNDEFFAPKENLLKLEKPVWREGEYTDRGKWMDGWETRRRRTPGHDWAIIRLGFAGVVRGVVIDTSYFTGNYPEQASLEGARLDADPTEPSQVTWRPLLAPTPLQGNAANPIAIPQPGDPVSHLLFNIYPDGGVARLRVYGDVVPADRNFLGDEVDLAALANGGVVIACSDRHYGNPQNMLQPGRSTFMGDGWETRRRRGPGNDWAVVRLGHRGIIARAELDTDHFKGNAPGSARLEGCDAAGPFDLERARWQPLIPESPLQPDHRHVWDRLPSHQATHVRLSIYPDGGVARLRLIGRAV